MQLEWGSGDADIRCPVCGDAGPHERLATSAVDWQADDVVVARCRSCRSIVSSATLPAEEYPEENVDDYVEQWTAIEVIAAELGRLDAPPGARMLDVGCGYGFGVDLARELRGWLAVGVDPSVAARRGRDELAADIRLGTLDTAVGADERFDVILASEMLEHLHDPVGFLVALRAHLAGDGLLLVTTPSAEAVRADLPLSTLQPVLAIGQHTFVAHPDALRAMFERAGLHASVRTAGSTLTVVASLEPATLDRFHPDAAVPLEGLADYCARRAKTAEPGSALAVGMTLRRVQFEAFSRGLAAATEALPALREAVLERHGVDLDDPVVADDREWAPVLAAACYFAGVCRLHLDDEALADRLFGLAEVVGEHHVATNGVYVAPDVGRYELQARGERAMLHARAAARELVGLEVAAARGAGDAQLLESFRARTVAALLPRPDADSPDEGAQGRRSRRLRRRA